MLSLQWFLGSPKNCYLSTKNTKSTKWGKRVFRRKAEARKTFKDVVKLPIVVKWVNESVTPLIYFRAFRVFRGLAAFLG